MSKITRCSLFGVTVLAGFVLLSPLILEILLGFGILTEEGSTIESRRPAYLVLMTIGIIILLFVAVITTLQTRRKPVRCKQ